LNGAGGRKVERGKGGREKGEEEGAEAGGEDEGRRGMPHERWAADLIGREGVF